jgi:hypothetical protein
MMEVSCKAAGGKSICAFPDVCFTPPQTPATPPGVPIPYPNTGMASDCTDGSSTVKISKQEVMLKNKSYFKRSMGDEAGCAPKKGVMTSKNMGKVYFTKWSMDVKVEGENVVRHLDLTTHNHGSNPNTAPWTYADRMANSPDGTCTKEKKKVEEKCSKTPVKDSAAFKAKKPYCPATGRLDAARRKLNNARRKAKRAAKKAGKGKTAYKRDDNYLAAMGTYKAAMDDLGKRTKANQCQQALRCFLPPYNDPPHPDPKRVNSKCCSGQTGHHLIPTTTVPSDACPGYVHGEAPVICVEGTNQHHGSHGKMHDGTDRALKRLHKQNKVKNGKIPYPAMRDAVIGVMQRTFGAGCTTQCLKDQMDNYYDKKCKKGAQFNAKDKQGKPIGVDDNDAF